VFNVPEWHLHHNANWINAQNVGGREAKKKLPILCGLEGSVACAASSRRHLEPRRTAARANALADRKPGVQEREDVGDSKSARAVEVGARIAREPGVQEIEDILHFDGAVAVEVGGALHVDDHRSRVVLHTEAHARRPGHLSELAYNGTGGEHRDILAECRVEVVVFETCKVPSRLALPLIDSTSN
jgi:hypothetical protein